MASRQHTWRDAWLRARWQQAALLTAVVVVTGALVVAALVRQSALAQDAESGPAQPIAVHTPGPDDDTVVVVIGDSFTGGSDMNTGPTWLEQLRTEHPDWIVVEDAEGGSGYVSPTRFIERLPEVLGDYQTDLLVVAGGRNDADYPNAGAAAAELLAKAHALSPTTDVLMLSPWASGDPTPEILALGDKFARVAKKHDAAYFDVTRVLRPADIGDDGIHPTDDGHTKMLAAIDAELTELELPRAGAYSG